MALNDFETYRSDDPRTHDPRFQRRVVSVFRPIPIVENMFDVTLECGHAPLAFNDSPIQVGSTIFCPSCYEQRGE
jgi:hypothetical protein